MDTRSHTNANIFLSLLPPTLHNNPTRLHTLETLEMLVVLIYDKDQCPPAARVTAVHRKSDYSCLSPADLCLQMPLQSEDSMVHSECYITTAAGKIKDRRLTELSDSEWVWHPCAVPFTDSITAASGILCISDGTNLIVPNVGKMNIVWGPQYGASGVHRWLDPVISKPTGASFPFSAKKIFSWHLVLHLLNSVLWLSTSGSFIWGTRNAKTMFIMMTQPL